MPALTSAAEGWVRTDPDSDTIRFSIILSDILIGRDVVKSVDFDAMKAYRGLYQGSFLA